LKYHAAMPPAVRLIAAARSFFRLRGYLTVALAAVLGVAGSLLGFYAVRHASEDKVLAELSIEAHNRARGLQQVLGRYEGMIEGFSASFPYAGLGRAEFQTYARNIFLASHMLRSGFERLAWAPHILDSERAAFEAQAQAEGHGDYRIRDARPGGAFLPASARPEYYPLRYLEPDDASAPFGLDALSSPSGGTILRQVIARGGAAATPPLRFATGVRGCVVYVPVYAPDAAAPGRPPTAAPVGILVFRLQFDATIDAILDTLDPAAHQYDLFVVDEGAPETDRAIYSRLAAASRAGSAPLAAADPSLPMFASSFDFAGRDWTVNVRPTPELLAARRGDAGWYELSSGLALTMLLSVYLASSRRRANRLQQEVAVRRSAEERLRRSEEHLARAQQIARMGSVDRDFRTDEAIWSDETYRIFGVRRGEFDPSTENFMALVHPEDRELIVHTNALMRQGVPPGPFEYRIIRPDGSERIIQRDNEVVFSDGGAPLRMVGTVRDITEIRVAEQRHRELEAQLHHSQRLEALGTLAGGIAHDLNNALTPVVALTKLVVGRLAEGTRERNNLEIVIKGASRARDLVKQILAFSRKEKQRRESVDLAGLLREALPMLRASLPSSIRLEQSIAPTPPVIGDPGQLHQVVVNLVTNAAQAIGEAPGTITLSLAPDGAARHVRLSVADNGCGMDEATRLRAFEPFFTTKRVGEGTGLGLSVVHGIVASHGGRIAVDSRPGEGARFDIDLPVAREASAAAGQAA
jgi:PAS domain S-box-containing protein